MYSIAFNMRLTLVLIPVIIRIGFLTSVDTTLVVTTSEIPAKSLVNISDEYRLSHGISEIANATLAKDRKEFCINSNEGHGCLHMICFESKISFNKRVVDYNWKIHNLRQYIYHRCSTTLNPSVLLMQQTLPFPYLPTKDADWVFQILCKPGSNKEVLFSVFSNVQSSPQGQSQHNETIYSVLFGVGGKNGNMFADWQNSSMACYQYAESAASNYSCSITFMWSLDDNNAMSPFLKDAQELIRQVDSFELMFQIVSSTPNEIVSDQVNCTNIWDIGVEFEETFTMKPPFLGQMQSIIKDEKYTDLILKSGDEEFKVHRVILANSSPTFARMVSNDSFVKNESLLDLGVEIGSDIVEEMIHYIYTGTIDGIEEIADRVIVAAAKYEFPDLKRICEKVLVSQLTIDNAFSLYFLGVEVQSEKLILAAFDVMKLNKATVANQTEDFRKLSVHHPDLMYKLFLS